MNIIIKRPRTWVAELASGVSVVLHGAEDGVNLSVLGDDDEGGDLNLDEARELAAQLLRMTGDMPRPLDGLIEWLKLTEPMKHLVRGIYTARDFDIAGGAVRLRKDARPGGPYVEGAIRTLQGLVDRTLATVDDGDIRLTDIGEWVGEALTRGAVEPLGQ